MVLSNIVLTLLRNLSTNTWINGNIFIPAGILLCFAQERNISNVGEGVSNGQKNAGKELYCHPSKVNRFERDHFNIYDGHHRVALADFCRVDYLKVKSPSYIYERYFKRRKTEIVKLVKNRIKKTGIFISLVIFLAIIG